MDKGNAYVSVQGTDHKRRGTENEDRFILFSKGMDTVLGVFDGISSGGNGGLAADICSKTVKEELSERLGSAPVKTVMLEALQRAHDAIIEAQSRTPSLSGMGCTATLVCLERGRRQVSVASIGDSAAFRLRKGVITKLTIDDSRYGGSIDRGTMSLADAMELPDPFSLTRWMGMPGVEMVPVRYSVSSLMYGDEFVVSTDGLHAYVDKKVIRRILLKGRDGNDIVRNLCERAVIKAGSKDDVTILYYHEPSGKLRCKKAPRPGMLRTALLVALVAGSFCAGVFYGKRKTTKRVRNISDAVSVVVAQDTVHVPQDSVDINVNGANIITIYDDENSCEQFR